MTEPLLCYPDPLANDLAIVLRQAGHTLVFVGQLGDGRPGRARPHPGGLVRARS